MRSLVSGPLHHASPLSIWPRVPTLISVSTAKKDLSIGHCLSTIADDHQLPMSADALDHPVQRLWSSHHPPGGYPQGVKAVPRPLPGLGFFPGGFGLWAVAPGQPLPDFPVGGVMVVGHDFHSEAGYLASAKLGGERLTMPTWRNLLALFAAAAIPPTSCFFTNLYMGLREGATSTGLFPGATSPRYVAHCKSFLREQVRVQRPALILTLGKYVPPALADLSPELACWSGLGGFKQIDEVGPVRHRVSFPGIDDFACTAIALLHPSLRLASVRHRTYKGSVGSAAELAMLADGLRAAGVATERLMPADPSLRSPTT
jgi:hypothetical protein